MKHLLILTLILVLCSCQKLVQTNTALKPNDDIALINELENRCGQKLDGLSNNELMIDHMDNTLTRLWVRVPEPKGSYQSVPVAYENYWTRGDVYSGKILSIVGNDNLNEIFSLIQSQSKEKAEKGDSINLSEYPRKNFDDSWTIVQPNRVIILKRFSVHMGLVAFICKEAWENGMR